MALPLTPEQQQALESAQEPVRFLNPRTNREYVLVRADWYERIQSVMQTVPGPGETSLEIPLAIRRSQESLRRDLPELLRDNRLLHQWAAYHGTVRIGIARTEHELIQGYIRRGLNDDEYYVGWIDPSELIEEEELEPPDPSLMVEGEDVPR